MREGQGYRAQLCTAEATPVILDRALCLLYLEEQSSGGVYMDTQAGQFWRTRDFHPAVSMVSAVDMVK